MSPNFDFEWPFVCVSALLLLKTSFLIPIIKENIECFPNDCEICSQRLLKKYIYYYYFGLQTPCVDITHRQWPRISPASTAATLPHFSPDCFTTPNEDARARTRCRSGSCGCQMGCGSPVCIGDGNVAPLCCHMDGLTNEEEKKDVEEPPPSTPQEPKMVNIKSITARRQKLKTMSTQVDQELQKISLLLMSGKQELVFSKQNITDITITIILNAKKRKGKSFRCVPIVF